MIDYLFYHQIQGVGAEQAFCMAYEDRPGLLRQCCGVLFHEGAWRVVSTADAGENGRPQGWQLGNVKAEETRPLGKYAVEFFSTRVELPPVETTPKNDRLAST